MSPEIYNSANFDTDELRQLVAPMLLRPLPEAAYVQLARYVRLLYRWNERMNLTAVRDPKLLVGLHIAECLRCAQLIPEGSSSVLDFGSGAGLPGIPIQIARPELAVTLGESQAKKAAFLRESVRELHLAKTSIHCGRVEDLPVESTFDVVALRAVDGMERALKTAQSRIGERGLCVVLTSEPEADSVTAAVPMLRWRTEPVPGTRQRVILLGFPADL